MMFDRLASLSDIKVDNHVIEHIIWDIEPKQLMEPKYRKNEDGKIEKKILRGYMFYIDKMAKKKPTLFLMCHTTMGYAETVAMIEEIPDEMIVEAMEENKDREYFGMFPINKKIENWLKKELARQ
ncbi:MAG: hypothetical protein HXY53_03820 [Nitrospirae bacterium]|nr:hypothetical protein [Nitrospirota bacterium]